MKVGGVELLTEEEYNALLCPVCFERWDTVLGCGHVLCGMCLPILPSQHCPLCRLSITNHLGVRAFKKMA